MNHRFKFCYVNSGPDDLCLYIDSNTRIQILDTVEQLPDAEKDQCGAFIRSDRSAILWSYSLETIIPLCKEFDEKLIKHIWRNRDSLGHRQTPSVLYYGSRSGSQSGGLGHPIGALSPSESQDQLDPKEKEAVAEELPVNTLPPAAKRPSVLRWWRLDPRTPSNPPKDPEKGDLKKKERKLVLIGPIYAGCGAGLAACKYTLCKIVSQTDE